MVNATDANGDEESTQPEIGAAFDSAVRKLARLLFDMKFECSAMDAALHAMDTVDLEIAANDIVCVWHAALGAFKSVRTRAEDVRTHERRVDEGIVEHRRLLEGLFGRALIRTTGSTAHDRLVKLFAEVVPLGDRGPENRSDRLLPTVSAHDPGSSGAS